MCGMPQEPPAHLPLRVACLGRYCIVYRPGGITGYYAVVCCATDRVRELATFATEAAARAWAVAQPDGVTAP